MSYRRGNNNRQRNRNGGTKTIADDDFTALAKSAVERIKGGEDLDELVRLQKVFKKAVPFGIRTYVGVYMTRQWLQKHGAALPPRVYDAPPPSPVRSDPVSSGTKTFSPQSKQPKQEHVDTPRNEVRMGRPRVIFEEAGGGGEIKRANIPADESATVFIGIGRTRRVSKGNIISLLAKQGELDRGRIGEIRILDSYTFVQLYASDADGVISKLDGYEFHGKALTVGYSHKDDNKEEAE